MISVKDDGFGTMVQSGTTLVDFYSKKCGPCMMLAPILTELSEEYPDITFVKADIEENQQQAAILGLISVPTLILFKDGKEVSRNHGLMPKMQLKEWITKNI